jgi:dTDP-4-dehydrorhamnose reductase
MKILLFGKNGQVGWELNRSLQPLGEVVALGREQADFSSPESLRDIVTDIKPDVIVNAVAYTAVDKAEEQESLAFIINGTAPQVLAEEASKLNALLVHYSTDYVFDGNKNKPYLETDKPCPINAYGRTKLAGEEAIQSTACDYLIFRTSWVYAARGHNFLLTILKLAGERDELSIVADQVGSPTSARLIADTTAHCVLQAIKERNAGKFTSDLYHLTAGGETSWFGFAKEIIEIANKKSGSLIDVKNVKAIASDEYQTPAERPSNSRLWVMRLEEKYNLDMPDWKNALLLSLGELLEN